jgi:hypothetical protein
MVIISASGMGDAGRVKHHISNNIENSHNTIFSPVIANHIRSAED